MPAFVRSLPCVAFPTDISPIYLSSSGPEVRVYTVFFVFLRDPLTRMGSVYRLRTSCSSPFIAHPVTAKASEDIVCAFQHTQVTVILADSSLRARYRSLQIITTLTVLQPHPNRAASATANNSTATFKPSARPIFSTSFPGYQHWKTWILLTSAT
jgi:hypothetical protein